jgi:hypothetical protein
MTRPGRPLLSSLGAFLRAGLKPSTPLQKTIVTALCIKLIAVIAMRIFLFSGDVRPPVDDGVLETRLVGPAEQHRLQP